MDINNQPDYNAIVKTLKKHRHPLSAPEDLDPLKEVMCVPPALSQSWESLLHDARPEDDCLLISRGVADDQHFQTPLAHRTIGILYHPEREEHGNYVPSVIPERYDAFLQLDYATGLHPKQKEATPDEIPKAYP